MHLPVNPVNCQTIHFSDDKILITLIAFHSLVHVPTIEDIQGFDIEYGIYFTNETAFLKNILMSEKHSENNKKKQDVFVKHKCPR